MTSYLREHGTRATPQSEPIPGSGQVENSAGGYSWQVDCWTRLRRFLILGSEGGSYYASERNLTRENADAVRECLAVDSVRTVDEIVSVSADGRAPKNDPAIFALALCASEGDDTGRRAALAAMPSVCRTGTHLFQFCEFAQGFRGWGRGLRRAVANWYTGKDPDTLAYQIVKYRQRGGWTHRDCLRLAHPRDTQKAGLYDWVCGRLPDSDQPSIIYGFTQAQSSASPNETARLIRDFGLPREAVNPDHLTDPDVWEALLADMPMTALIRNLATMTRVGLLKPMSDAAGRVLAQLGDADRIRKARVHPIQMLSALATYQSGQGARGQHTWTPVPQIVDALDAGFYLAFGNVRPSGKRTLLALDVSGSMEWSTIAGVPGLTPRVASAAMALVTAATEPQWAVMAFGTRFVPLDISPRERLDSVLRKIDGLGMMGTDCSRPILWAQSQGVEVDAFVVYTDSETWAGRVHPSQALREYRRGFPGARLCVVGMVSNGFTIADPNDPGMLDVVGFDTSAPQVISDFSRGEL